jgi:alpha-D-ribose 1-methylphosphonate 5-triphosphate synthase subunit PhnG
MTNALTREERLGLLTAASAEELIDAADACLAAASSFAVVTPPSVGCVPAQVREPVRRQRFFLGDVLACTAEVEFDGVRGWAMRLGDDRAAALAMAVLDAAAARSPSLAREVDALCARAAGRRAEADAAEWAELSPTIVQFEEL